MTPKSRIRLALTALVASAIIFPVAVYGQDGEGGPGRDVQSLTALDTSFNFQGRLSDGGAAANGVYDFNFYLYDSAAGGSQQGPVQTIGDVTVAAGLFTVDLNFGDIFNGDQYFLEIQVRPGASTGSYSILSPREVIGAVPNSLYAVTAGKIALPSESVAGTNGPLLKIVNTGTGADAQGIVAETASSSPDGAAIYGRATSAAPDSEASGVTGTAAAGIGVEGISVAGPGVYGASLGGSGGVFTTLGGTALEVSGPIKVSGSKAAAFVHTATAPSNHVTVIDHPSTNDNPNAILIVTQMWSGVYNPHPVGVFYAAGKWRIFNEDIADMPLNAQFNIMVINR